MGIRKTIRSTLTFTILLIPIIIAVISIAATHVETITDLGNISTPKETYSCFPKCTVYINLSMNNSALNDSQKIIFINNIVDSPAISFENSYWNASTLSWVAMQGNSSSNEFFDLTNSLEAINEFRINITLSEPVSAEWNFSIWFNDTYYTLNTTHIDSINLTLPLNDSSFYEGPKNLSFKLYSNSHDIQSCDLFIDGVLNFTNSTVFNNSLTTILVDNLTTSDEYWFISCNETGNSSLNFFNSILPDATPPIVILSSPKNLFNSTTSSVSFNCSAYDSTNITNMSVYSNWTGTWSNNFSNLSPTVVNVGVNNFSSILTVSIIDLTENESVWNCFACDNSSNCAFASSNYSMRLDRTPPKVSIVYPANNTKNISVSTNLIINFTEQLNLSTISTSTIILKNLNSGEIFYGSITPSFGGVTNQYDPYLNLAFNSSYMLNVSSVIKDVSGNNMTQDNLTYFDTQRQDSDLDGSPDNEDGDDDNDGIEDLYDYFVGNESNVNTNIAVLNMTINSISNLSNLTNSTGSVEFRIMNGSVLLANFSYTLANNTRIDFSNVTLLLDENSSKGSFVMAGITIPSSTYKTFYLRNVSNYTGVCIKDTEGVQSVTSITERCNGDLETWISCPGASGQYSCNRTTNETWGWKVSGLSHSGVTQANDTIPPTISDMSVEQNRSTTAVTANLTFITNELSTCRYSTSNESYGSMSAMIITGSYYHEAQRSYSSEGSKSLYVSCVDSYLNYAWSSITFSATLSSSSSTSSSSGGSGGGGGSGTTTDTDTDTGISYSRFWSNLGIGSQTLNIAKTGLGIVKVEFYNAKSTTSSQFKVIALDEKPASVSASAPNNIYQYIKFEITNIDEEDLSNILIEFRVPKTWIEQYRIDNTKISLYRYNNAAWTKRTTSSRGHDVDYYYYEASTPGFSYFAIAGENITIESANNSQLNISTSGNESQSDEDGINNDLVGSSATSPDNSSDLKKFIWILYSAMFILGIYGGIMIFRNSDKIKNKVDNMKIMNPIRTRLDARSMQKLEDSDYRSNVAREQKNSAVVTDSDAGKNNQKTSTKSSKDEWEM